MRLKRYLLLVFLVCPMFAYGQGSRKDDVATKNLVTGLAAAPGALITVCTSAGVGVPCTPLANIYSDVGLTSLATNGSAANAVSCSIGPTTNPCLADSNGNYGFYASPGRYVVTVTGAGTTGKSVVYTLACDPSASCTVSGTTMLNGSSTIPNENAQFFVDGTKYANCGAAYTAAQTYASGTVVTIPGTGPIVDCPANQTTENIVLRNYDKTRDWCNGIGGSATPPCNAENFNYDDGNVFSARRYEFTTSHQDVNGVSLGLYSLTYLKNATANGSSGIDGFSAEANTAGTLTGTFANVQAHEANVSIQSNNGTVTNAAGGVFAVGTFSAGGTPTAVTNMFGIKGVGCRAPTGATPVNCYGGYFNDQQARASSRNYSLGWENKALIVCSNSVCGIDAEDLAHATHPFIFIDGSSSPNIQALNTNGVYVLNQAGGIAFNAGNGGKTLFSTTPTPNTAGNQDLGNSAIPWGTLWLLNAATGSAGKINEGYDATTGTEQHNSNNNGASSFSGAWNCTNVTPVTVNANVATDQNLMACTIPAGTLNRVGRSLQINIAGVYSTVAASTASLTYKVKLCTVSGCGSGTVITLASIATGTTGALTAASFPFNITLQSTTQTAGASSAYEAHGRLVIDITSALAADSVFADSNTATVGTIDDTAQLFLQVTAASASASASNSWTQRQLIVQTIN